MSRERYHLTDHARLDAIPLRIGQCLRGTKLYLEAVEDDPDGTGQQAKGDRDRGNRHVLADLWTDRETGDHLGRWRLVVGLPRESFHDRPVVTVLPVDASMAKSHGSVTDLLKRERQSGKHAWLTDRYIADVLHPLYKNGELGTVEKLAAHIRERVVAPLHEELDSLAAELTRALDESRNRALERDQALAEVDQLRKALQDPSLNGSPAFDEQPLNGLDDAAQKVTDVWRSRKPGSRYHNVGVNARIISVESKGPKIYLTFVDSHGEPKQICDFGYDGLVDEVFGYLKARQGRRAVFILTWKDDNVARLASDTMRLESYRDLWAREEVSTGVG